jgi:hypothetical protein
MQQQIEQQQTAFAERDAIIEGGSPPRPPLIFPSLSMTLCCELCSGVFLWECEGLEHF